MGRGTGWEGGYGVGRDRVTGWVGVWVRGAKG